jgi:hypothetical protein
MTTTWISLDPGFRAQHLGLLWDILQADDKRPVKEQLEDRYAHGGGWRPFGEGHFKLDRMTMNLRFPGDPPFRPAAFTQIGDETVVFYPNCSLLMVLQKDGKYEVTRVD